jgi:hypothetical protein
MRTGSLLVLTVLTMMIAAPSRSAGQRAPQGDPAEDALHVVLPRDAIPAIFDPEFEPASKASLADHELVIGVVGEREQRAYSTWQLDRHEIVNDVFEGKPVAVTW